VPVPQNPRPEQQRPTAQTPTLAPQLWFCSLTGAVCDWVTHCWAEIEVAYRESRENVQMNEGMLNECGGSLLQE
jgi:hypothetical protein